MTLLMNKLIYSVIILVFFYFFIKSQLIILTKYFVKLFKFNHHIPFSDIQGAMELLIIAVAHSIFCFILCKQFVIIFPIVTLSTTDVAVLTILSVLLGIGCMSLSALLCKFIIHLITTFRGLRRYGNAESITSLDMESWLAMGRGGWIKHHLQSLEVFPIYISMLILTMQVGSEEIIFRGLFYQYFIQFGSFAAAIISILLFVMMQYFFMNKWEAALFPMVGAAVMGIVHTFFYAHIPLLFPLIISHISFFLFSVM